MGLTNKEKQVLSSQREILWLKRQIEQLERDEHTESESGFNVIPPTATDEHVEESIEDYRRHIDTLKTNFDMLYQFNQSKEALLRSVNSQHFTVQSLYPNDEDLEIKRDIEEKINKRDELVVQFMQTLKQLNKKKTELTHTQRLIIRQHEKNKEITKRINLIRENKNSSQNNDPESIELLKVISDKKDQMAVVRGVLNGIILESGIPWEEDERWLATILRIGEPFQSPN